MTHWPNSLLFLSSSLYTHISFAYIVYITNFKIKRNSPLISTFMGFYFWFYAKYGITFTIQFFLFEMTMKMILFKSTTMYNYQLVFYLFMKISSNLQKTVLQTHIEK